MSYTAYTRHMGYPFIAARHFTRTDGRKIDLVVLHSMEAPEKGDTAEAVANYFARGTVVASAHYNVDSDSIVQSVREQDVAYHAPGANHNGIGIEHAGYARQSPAEWADAYSTAMLKRSARLTAELCQRYAIPAVFVTQVGLLRGERGITTHAEVSRAFKRSTHTDPGAAFPMTWYLALVRAAAPQPILPEVRPMIDPPVTIPSPVVATLQPEDRVGMWQLCLNGSIYAWDCKDWGAPNRHPEYWNIPGQTAARLEPFRGGYTVVDNAGRRYDYAAS